MDNPNETLMRKKALVSRQTSPEQNIFIVTEDIPNLAWVEYLRKANYWPMVDFELPAHPELGIQTVKGRNARTLLELYLAGESGLTAATATDAQNWAYRLASYVFNLRHKYGIGKAGLVAHKEQHTGGNHARYELVKRVSLVEIWFKPVKPR